MRKARLNELDFLRGVAILGMMALHTLIILHFFDKLSLNFYTPLFLIPSRIVQFTFIGLVGVGLYLSKSSANSFQQFYLKQLKRALLIFSCGILVSLMSAIFIPDFYVRFGILHFIGFSILLAAYFANKPYLSLFLAVITFFIGEVFSQIVMPNELWSILGFKSETLNTLDHFSIFPWISCVFAGMVLANVLYSKGQRFNFPANKLTKPVIFLGKKSLLIYMLHVPVIIGLLCLMGVINL